VTSPDGLFSARYRWTTIGASALVFLGAFETLAVTTIMPIISSDLHGESLYSVAFSATIVAGIIGMVAVGQWSDRSGPTAPLLASIAVFLLGLLLSGTAGTMNVFVAGRFLQGLGAGGINVALYVVVARLYPAALHPRVFGAFAAAWVLPSLIGPPFAGIVAGAASWHWVFLGVGVLVVVASAAIVPAIRELKKVPSSADATPNRWAIPLSIVVAVGVLAISLGGEAARDFAWLVVLVSIPVIVLAVRPLLPPGSLIASPGLPAAIAVRAIVAASFFSVEVYLPFLLTADYGLAPWLAGLILTVGAVSWAIGSHVQGTLTTSHAVIIRLGAACMSVGIAVQFITALFLLSPVVAAAGWLVAGFGMGLVYPRLSTLVLAHSARHNEGFNSAALSIADSTGAAISIAVGGLIFIACGATSGMGFAAVLGFSTLISLLAVPVARRVRDVEVRANSSGKMGA
jgi:MFS family permease